MFFDNWKSVFFRKSPRRNGAELQMQGLSDNVQQLKDSLAKEEQTRLSYERLIVAYKHVVPLNTTIQVFCFFERDHQYFTTIREGGNSMHLQLFCPMLQCHEIDEQDTLRPLAELLITINNDTAKIEELKVNPKYQKKGFGVTLLSTAFPELNKKKCHRISGTFQIPDGEEQRIKHFFNLYLIPILVDRNLLYITESELWRRPETI